MTRTANSARCFGPPSVARAVDDPTSSGPRMRIEHPGPRSPPRGTRPEGEGAGSPDASTPLVTPTSPAAHPPSAAPMPLPPDSPTLWHQLVPSPSAQSVPLPTLGALYGPVTWSDTRITGRLRLVVS